MARPAWLSQSTWPWRGACCWTWVIKHLESQTEWGLKSLCRINKRRELIGAWKMVHEYNSEDQTHIMVTHLPCEMYLMYIKWYTFGGVDMYLVFTCMPGESTHSWFRSLLLVHAMCFECQWAPFVCEWAPYVCESFSADIFNRSSVGVVFFLFFLFF